MYDLEIVMDTLQKISKAIETILERAAVVTDPNDLLCSPADTWSAAVSLSRSVLERRDAYARQDSPPLLRD